MSLTTKQKKFLRARAHTLKPVVIVGAAGVTDAVISEIESSIEHHELLKVRLNASNRDEQKSMIDRICREIHAELVNSIGHVATFYRASAKPVLKIPNS